LDKIQKTKLSPMNEYAVKYLQDYFSSIYPFPVIVKPETDKSIKIYVPESNRGQVI
jgi:hypothetical protein